MLKKYILGILILCSAYLNGAEKTEKPGYEVIEDKTSIPILSPYYAKRKIFKMRLDNGLKVYIVSDPVIEKSAAAMVNNAGSWQDPAEHPGLAHFLEHMLFLGTKKYPEESSYDAFIKSHGGLDNAFTEDLYTTYLFDIGNDAFPDALDRFSQFFKEPLFNPSGVSREMKAIAQEYNENIENDQVRRAFVDKALTNPKHPDHAFNIGNAATLSGISTEYLNNWFVNHYSANLMTLVIYSPLPLDTLKQLVVTYFQDVPNRNLKPFSSEEKIFSPDYEKKIAYIVPINDIHTLTIAWELPKKFVSQEEKKPDELLCYVLGNEGKGSLLASLQEDGFVEELGCGKIASGLENASFYLQIELTKLGLKKVDLVIERCFQAIAGIQKTGIPKYIFDDLRQIQTLRYQYPSLDTSFHEVMQEAIMIRTANLSTYPENASIIQVYDPTLVQELAMYLNPKNARFSLMASPKETKVLPDRKEPWLDVEYAVKDIPQGVFSAWEKAKPHPELTLPPPNPFIPKGLKTSNEAVNNPVKEFSYPHPLIILDDAMGKMYYAQDHYYQSPKVSWTIKVKTPQINRREASKIVLADLYVKALKENLSAFSYPAKLAGIDYEISRQDDGIEITVNGYSENSGLLLEEIFKNLTLTLPSEDKFKLFKESLERQYVNFYNDSPLQTGVEVLRQVLYQDFVTENEKLIALKSISLENFQNYLSSIYKENYSEGMFYGNMSQELARELWNKLRDSLKGSPYPKDKQPVIRVVNLPENGGPYFWEKQIKARGNIVIVVLEDIPYSFEAQAVQDVLSQAIKDPFFAELRTKQQTGYLVFQKDEEIERHLFSIFAVQSHTHDPRDLLARIELFFETFSQGLRLGEFSEETFHNIKAALLRELRQPPQSIKKMGEVLNRLAFRYDGDFDRFDKEIKGLSELTYSQFVDKALNFLGREDKRRFAILLRGQMSKGSDFQYHKIKSLPSLHEKSTFSSRFDEKPSE